MPEKLNTASIQGWLKTRKGWKRRSNKLVKDFGFESFRSSIVFVNRVASLADTADHHPEIEIFEITGCQRAVLEEEGEQKCGRHRQ